MITRCFLLLFSLFFAALTQTRAQNRYHITEYTTDNGLPSNGLKGLQWDEENGFLWIATEAGMSRYNGLEFTNFTRENTRGLFHERMAFLVKNNSGQIFASDVSGNILEVQQNTLIYRPLEEISEVIGYKKRFYLTTQGERMRKKILAISIRSGNESWDRMLQFSDSSVLLIAGKKTPLFSYASDTGYYPLQLPVDFGSFFMADEQLFYLTPDRKFRAITNNLSAIREISLFTENGELLVPDKENFLLYWDNGMHNPILFSGNKAWTLHFRKGVLTASLVCDAVPTNSYIRFAQYSAKNKILFLGTDSKGIIIIRENRVTPMKKKETDIRERNAYYSQIEIEGHRVLTNEGHLIGEGPQPASLPIQGKFNYTIYSRGDSLWFAQASAAANGAALLHCYNYRNGETLTYTKLPRIQESFAMTFSDGRFYLASSNGLGYLERDSIHLLFPGNNNNQISAAPYVMLEFAPSVLGVASCDGLILYNTRSLRTDTLLKMPGYCVRNLWRFNDYIFIGTYGKGYYIWKNGVLKPMPLDKNSFLLYTHCFVPDEKGYCWISTNRGLFKAQLTDLLYAWDNNLANVYYHYYGRNDGMDITEMNGGCAPCALVMHNGTISFPSMDGLLWVDPEKASPLLPEGQVYIDEFTAGGKKMNPDSLNENSIAPKNRDIRIRIGFSAWCNKENVYLDYRLNEDKEWVPVDLKTEAYIQLNNLEPGTYHLQIRKMNGFGPANYSYKEIVFTIRTPWYLQWWFYLLLAGLLFAAIRLYLRFRTRQYEIRQRKLEMQVAEKTKELQEQNEVLEKNNSIKTRLISIISHDIVTPLKFLTVAGKNLIQKRKMMSEDLQVETLQEITNTSQELQLLSTNILNWIKYQNENRRLAKETFSLYEMVDQVLGLLQSLARQKNLVIENRVDPGLEVQVLYEPLKILVYNLLTNAIQFTEKGNITVTANRENSHLRLAVEDQGIGMSPEQIQRLMADEVVITSANVDNKKGHGLGYLIIKDLLKTMDASLSIQSKKGSGTTVSVSFPQ